MPAEEEALNSINAENVARKVSWEEPQKKSTACYSHGHRIKMSPLLPTSNLPTLPPFLSEDV